MKCDNSCGKNATVLAEWEANEISRHHSLCRDCARSVWDKFGRTTIFTFSPITLDENDLAAIRGI